VNELPPAPAPPVSPWQRFYGALLARRARSLAAHAEHLPVPVVSIGNLGWGGGGKTPFTLAVARRAAAEGRRVAILSRGYGRTSTGPLLVSRGDGPAVAVDAAGDEPFAMATELAGCAVAVAVAERRAAAGRLALAELDGAIDLFLLDDGFSHAALARDVDLLLFPSADPWSGGRLLPAGRLREPLAAATRADAVVLTGASGDEGAALAEALAKHGYRGPGFASGTSAGAARDDNGDAVAAGSRVLAVAAIARPEGFLRAAGSAGLEVVAHRLFRDHHRYDGADLRSLEAEARRAGAAMVLTTTKDRAKLAGRLPLPLAVLPITAEPEPAFWRWLDARLGEVAR